METATEGEELEQRENESLDSSNPLLLLYLSDNARTRSVDKHLLPSFQVNPNTVLAPIMIGVLRQNDVGLVVIDTNDAWFVVVDFHFRHILIYSNRETSKVRRWMERLSHQSR